MYDRIASVALLAYVCCGISEMLSSFKSIYISKIFLRDTDGKEMCQLSVSSARYGPIHQS